MNTPTFKEQFDKITRAYFLGELVPLNPCGCFVGNLLNNNGGWCYHHFSCPINEYTTICPTAEICIGEESNGLYSYLEIRLLEKNFMDIWVFEQDEDALFKAMDSTLDMLRKIHESNGEVIEDFEFTKRQLAI